MFRMIGILIIMAGSCGCGYSIVKERTEYLERCRSWLELLGMMENEMAFRKSSLPEICSRAGRHLTGAQKLFLEKVNAAFTQNKGETFGDVWRREIEEVWKEETLKKEIQKELESLGEKLYFEESGMQRKVLSDMEKRLKKHMEEQEEANREKNKLTLCAGVLGGAFLAILLL